MPPNGDLAHNRGMCPDLGIKPATFWFAGQHSIHWATPARAVLGNFLSLFCVLYPGWFSLSVSLEGDVSPWNTMAEIPPWLLMVSSGAQRSNFLQSPGVRVDRTFSFRKNSFLHSLTTKLINYYLKLKFSSFWVPPSLLVVGYASLYISTIPWFLP